MTALSDFIDAAISASVVRGYHLWWRGQANASWDLIPSVYRGNRGHLFERNAVTRFKQRAPGFASSCPRSDDYPGWLGFMQHYRMPTRLLDWTESPLIAAYFAAEGIADAPGRVWALDPYLLNKHYWQLEVVLDPYETPKELFRPPFEESAVPVEKIAAVPAFYLDSRMKAQLAAFTIHGVATPLNHITGTKGILQSFDIPTERKGNMNKELFALGIRRSAIFPELQSLAEEISSMTWEL